MFAMLTILGVPLVVIVGTICACLGCYVFGGYVVKRFRKLKRERDRLTTLENNAESAFEFGAAAYNHLKDPAVREATVRDIAADVYTALKAGDLPLADQFKSRTTVEEPTSKE